MSVKFDTEKGCWIVSYSKRHPLTGEPISARRRVRIKAKVHQVERELVAQVERKITEKVVPKWRDVIEKYVADCEKRGIAKITIYNTRTCVEAATVDKWGSLFVNEITTQQIRDFIQFEFADRAASHQKTMLKYLKLIFNFALERGFVERNPVPRIAFRIGDKIRQVLTEEQARFFLNMAKKMNWEWYPHCATALYTGMRNGELFALTWDKVNLAERQILVDCAWNCKDGFKETKSGNDRIVEIAPNLLPVLKELKLSAVDSFVLPHMRDWEKGEQARQLRCFLTGIGLPSIRFHDLRATWATLMLSKGVAPAKVMMMGGWKDMKTMMIYMRKSGIDIKGITDCLNLHDPSVKEGKLLDFG